MKHHKIHVFDFDNEKQWARVLSFENDPLVLRALDAGMNAVCTKLGMKWERELGPWRFSNRNSPNWKILSSSPPLSNQPNWYRVCGLCGAIAAWCTALGMRLFPDHLWYYAYNLNVPQFGNHSAGVGFKDGETQSLIVMDILFSPMSLREGTTNWLAHILTNEDSKHITLMTAIERFESGQFSQ